MRLITVDRHTTRTLRFHSLSSCSYPKFAPGIVGQSQRNSKHSRGRFDARWRHSSSEPCHPLIHQTIRPSNGPRTFIVCILAECCSPLFQRDRMRLCRQSHTPLRPSRQPSELRVCNLHYSTQWLAVAPRSGTLSFSRMEYRSKRFDPRVRLSQESASQPTVRTQLHSCCRRCGKGWGVAHLCLGPASCRSALTSPPLLARGANQPWNGML